MDLKKIGMGALAGAVAAFVGYLKSGKGKGEAFDVSKLVPEVLIGALIGAYADWKGITMDESTLALSAAVIPFADSVMQVIFGWGKNRLASVGTGPLLPPAKV
ncbi:MAG TPA: hypothetical protein VJB38_12370 [Bacteroidota bacterium]|nr:hypothetical protein [Bacteroidota bacterium]